MKKKLVALTVIILIGLIPYLMAQPGDPITSNVYPIMVLEGDTVIGGAVETDPNYTTVFEVLSSPPGFSYSLSKTNTFQFQYTSDAIGIAIAYVQATVVQPYKGRPVVWAIQIDTRSNLVPQLEWFHSPLY